MTLVELLEQRILDAADLERLDRHGVKLEPRPHRYEGLDPKDLVTSPVPVGVLPERLPGGIVVRHGRVRSCYSPPAGRGTLSDGRAGR